MLKVYQISFHLIFQQLLITYHNFCSKRVANIRCSKLKSKMIFTIVRSQILLTMYLNLCIYNYFFTVYPWQAISFLYRDYSLTSQIFSPIDWDCNGNYDSNQVTVWSISATPRHVIYFEIIDIDIQDGDDCMYDWVHNATLITFLRHK